jgi:hypothetical protein
MEPGEDWSWCYIDQLALDIRVGDDRSGSVKRVASAVGEGSVCVHLPTVH